MQDEQTKSIWTQIDGRVLRGPLVEQGIQLPAIPLVMMTWSEWQKSHPDTMVLKRLDGFVMQYKTRASRIDQRRRVLRPKGFRQRVVSQVMKWFKVPV